MPKKTEITFEDALARLEVLLTSLESGEASLDEMLKLYEEGVGLIRFCNERLTVAEQSVKMLQLQPDGSVALTDFAGREEN